MKTLVPVSFLMKLQASSYTIFVENLLGFFM